MSKSNKSVGGLRIRAVTGSNTIVILILLVYAFKFRVYYDIIAWPRISNTAATVSISGI